MAGKRRLKFRNLRRDLYEFALDNYKPLSVFIFLHFAFFILLCGGLGGISTLWFLPWGLGYYLLNFVFFRWYFKRTPYLLTTKFFDTLLPAAKVLCMVMLGITLLAYLPYLPLLFSGVSETLKRMITVFIGDFMDDSNIYNGIICLVFFLMAPFIFYRPLLAWVASVIGRSGFLRNAFKHTAGYYGLFLGILAIFFVPLIIAWNIDTDFALHHRLLYAVAAPMMVLFNLFLAKTYESLFLD